MYIYEVKMKEYAVEKHLISVTQACGGMCIKFTSPGMSGVPDRIVILPGGKIGFAELKAPGKKAETAAEKCSSQVVSAGLQSVRD